MQEFSSVTASSYDADSLAPMLTEKSAEGWTVVSIVSAGTNIVAYLERESDGSAAADETPAIDDTTDVTPDEATEEAPAEETAPYVPAAAAGVAADAASSETATSDAASPAVDEPAGWAVAPEQTSEAAAAEPATDESLAGLVADVEAADAASTTEEAATTEAADEPAAQAPAAESTVPAGWYADPSGRFELRYWDGTAWTEHVSRAGQQFTDPPVA